MKKVFIVIMTIAALITAGIVIFGIVGVATAGTIEKTYQFTYTSSSTPRENIDIDTDISRVIVNYNSTPMDSYMDANLSVRIEGLFMEGKTIRHFFNEPTTQNNTADKRIEFTTKQDQWFDPSTWFSTKISTLTILLRSNVIYNIDIDVSVGDISLNVPENVTVGNLNLISSTGSISTDLLNNTTVDSINVKTSTGNVALNTLYTNHTSSLTLTTDTGNIEATISNGIIDGDITTDTDTGTSTLRVYNVTYQTNSVWALSGDTGNINIHIKQDETMNANVSGTATTSTGNINVNYEDRSTNVGVRLVGSTSTGTADDYTSSDFATATCKYDLDLSTSTGNVNIDYNDIA